MKLAPDANNFRVIERIDKLDDGVRCKVLARIGKYQYFGFGFLGCHIDAGGLALFFLHLDDLDARVLDLPCDFGSAVITAITDDDNFPLVAVEVTINKIVNARLNGATFVVCCDNDGERSGWLISLWCRACAVIAKPGEEAHQGRVAGKCVAKRYHRHPEDELHG